MYIFFLLGLDFLCNETGRLTRNPRGKMRERERERERERGGQASAPYVVL